MRETIEGFDALFERTAQLQGRWCFRGQREADWALQTALDRASKRELADGYDHYPRHRSEAETLDWFKKVIRASSSPTDDDLASWLSVMQHHQVPTRLFDWTYSLGVALFFALETAPAGTASAVWAIDLDWLETRAAHVLGLQRASSLTAQEISKQLADRNDRPAILRVTPALVPRRMAAQQGLFLCKLVDGAHFDKIVATMLYHSDPAPLAPVVLKFEIPAERRQSMVDRLAASRVTREALFPEPELDPFGAIIRDQLTNAIEKSIADGESFW